MFPADEGRSMRVGAPQGTEDYTPISLDRFAWKQCRMGDALQVAIVGNGSLEAELPPPNALEPLASDDYVVSHVR